MVIVPVNNSVLTEQARSLFRLYQDFLSATQACGYFDHAKFAMEIDTLPLSYTDRNGAVLLALDQEQASGCVAYRAAGPAGSCEIKRLYVLPAARGSGVARALVAEALQQARKKGFTRMMLDTDLAHMPGAEHLYLSLGFREFGARRGSIAFYELALQP